MADFIENDGIAKLILGVVCIVFLIFCVKDTTMKKGKPKEDGTGGGNRANRGRGGCKTTRSTGRGRRR